VKRSHLVALRDILETIDAVADMIAGVRLESYRHDFKLRRAAERCIEIISEASRKIPEDMKARFPDQPWPEISAMGNLLRHEYGRIDDLIIWKIATRSLPELRAAIVYACKRWTIMPISA
jgi:uncharacterized protein with HEPN domain